MKFNKFFSLVALLVLSIALPSNAWGQCTEGTTTATNFIPESRVAQSITALCDGPLDYFSYTIGENGPGNSATVELREGAGCTGNLIASEDFTQVEGENTVAFSTQPILTNGQVYTFYIKDNTTFTTYLTSNSEYEGGDFHMTAGCFALEGVDLVFNYSMTDNTNTAAVPTMGEWALIIFGLIIMSMGVITVKRREELFNLKTT